MYRVIRRNPNAWHWEYGRQICEIIELGYESKHLDAAVTEQSARNLLIGEGEPHWIVEEDGWTAIDPDDYLLPKIDDQDVYNYLVEILGVPKAEAEQLVS